MTYRTAAAIFATGSIACLAGGTLAVLVDSWAWYGVGCALVAGGAVGIVLAVGDWQ